MARPRVIQGGKAGDTRLRNRLHLFLTSAFSINELTTFLHGLPDGADLMRWLPNPATAALSPFAYAAAEKLIRDQRLDGEFFERLTEAAPRRTGEIDEIIGLCRHLRSVILSPTPSIRSNELLRLVDWIQSRTRSKRRFGGLAGLNVAFVSLVAWNHLITPPPLLHAAAWLLLGALIGYKFPARRQVRQTLTALEDACIGLVMLEAAQAPGEAKQALLSHLMTTLHTLAAIRIDPAHLKALTHARIEQIHETIPQRALADTTQQASTPSR